MALEFLLKLQDMLTPKLGKSLTDAQQRIDRLNAVAKRAGQEMGNSFETVRKKIDELKHIAETTTNWRIFRDAAREAQRLELQLDRLNSKAIGNKLGAGSSGGGMMGLLGLGGSLYAGKEFLQKSLEQAARFENQQIAFKVLTGSKSVGDAMMRNIQKMADVTPFESQDLGRSAKTMLGYGVGVNNIMPMLKDIGDIASAQDDAAGSLQSLSLAYGQIFAKGHLAGQEALQMINAGFNPLKEISIMTGKSMADLDKTMEKGGITIAMVDKAFQHATGDGGKFHNMMKEQSETLGGKWSTFMDSVHTKLRTFGEELAPAAKRLLDFITIGKTLPETLTEEKNEITSLLGIITQRNEGDKLRKDLLQQLNDKYPTLFKNIDIEKAKNADLLTILAGINAEYTKKIGLATSNLIIDTNKQNAQDAQSRLTRYSAIVELLTRGDAASLGTYSQMRSTPEAFRDIFGSKEQTLRYYKNQQLFAQRDLYGAQQNIGRESGIKTMQELNNTFDEAYKLVHDKGAMKGVFGSDKKSMQGFIDLASKIYATGNTYSAPGGISYADKLNALMHPATAAAAAAGGNAHGSDIIDAASTAMQGQKTITINIQQLGPARVDIHSTTIKEGAEQVKKILQETFLRVVASAQGLSPTN